MLFFQKFEVGSNLLRVYRITETFSTWWLPMLRAMHSLSKALFSKVTCVLPMHHLSELLEFTKFRKSH